MKDQQFILVDYLVKHFSGTLSQTDIQSLQKIFEDNPTLRDQWEKYTSQGVKSSDAQFWNSLDLDQARAKIVTYEPAKTAIRPVGIRSIRNLKIYVGIAASLLVIIGAALLLNTTHQDKQIVADQVYHYKNDVLPGGQKATLTLSDGKTIALSHEQATLQEKNGEQLQISDGQLHYK